MSKLGEYQFSERESPSSLLLLLNSGKVIQHSVTFIEGSRFADALKILSAQDNIESLLPSTGTLQALHAAGINVDHPEGWFYPDTFAYTAGDTDISILLRSYKKMQMTLAEEWQKRDGDLPYKNSYEALIMASIIEKETGVAYERGQIAGVFVRRLAVGMRLQTDPTVIYGMGEKYQGNITRKDLRRPSVYNTYTIKGLPPTPIALPGVDAIRAALHPELGDALYFVAKGDGTHYFSSSLEEHNKAVQRFQKKRVRNYRSAPPEGNNNEG